MHFRSVDAGVVVGGCEEGAAVAVEAVAADAAAAETNDLPVKNVQSLAASTEDQVFRTQRRYSVSTGSAERTAARVAERKEAACVSAAEVTVDENVGDVEGQVDPKVRVVVVAYARTVVAAGRTVVEA